MVARARSTARAEFWALSSSSSSTGLSSDAFMPSGAAAAAPLSPGVMTHTTGPAGAPILDTVGEFDGEREASTGKGRGGGGGRGGGEGGRGRAGGVSDGVVSSSEPLQHRQKQLNDCGDDGGTRAVVLGGRALGSRAVKRRRIMEQQEREAERELLLRRAEDEAERNVKRCSAIE